MFKNLVSKYNGIKLNNRIAIAIGQLFEHDDGLPRE